MEIEFLATARLIESILQKPHNHQWTLQGFGMLRMYLGGDMRLNIWDHEEATKNILDSSVHTHPWSFTSMVVAGTIYNTRFLKVKEPRTGLERWNEQHIQTGMGGMLKGDPRPVLLERQEPEVYRPGATYHQLSHEIHLSQSDRGTITINDRQRLEDGENALTYWRGEKWVSAEPKLADAPVVKRMCDLALAQLQFSFGKPKVIGL